MVQQKQGSVALSSSGAECIDLSECSKEVKWIREVMKEFAIFRDEPTVIEEDDSGAIKWATRRNVPNTLIFAITS